MALDLVTAAIIERIRHAMAEHEGGSARYTISLASPDGGDDQADLVMFLYLVTPDADLRSAERLRPYPAISDPPQRFEPAVPVELRFLVTLGKGAPAGAAGLSRLAGAIRAIESASPLPVPAAFQAAVWLSLLPLTTDELSRIWGLFPNENCRTSFAFRAAPVWIEPKQPAPASPNVTQDTFHSGMLESEPA